VSGHVHRERDREQGSRPERGEAGSDGTRSVNLAAESIVHPADSNLPTFMLAENGITVNGFLVEDNLNNAGIQTSPTFSGYQILNNIVRDNVFGIYLHGDGAATTLVRRNLLDGNNRQGAASGNGIYSDQGALGIAVLANSFRNHTNAGILFATAGTQQESIIIQNDRSLKTTRSLRSSTCRMHRSLRTRRTTMTTPTSGLRSSSVVTLTGSSSSGTSS
jgi:hypothetical protein